MSPYKFDPVAERDFIIVGFIQALLFGLYIATLLHCLRWLLFSNEGWTPRKKIQWPVLVPTTFIFLFATVSIALIMTISQTVATVGLAIANYAMELSTVIFTDAVLIYRCWVLYSRSWRVICAPFILWLADIGCMILIIYLFPFSDPLRIRIRHAMWEVFYSCNIAVNIYTTAAIVYRLLSAAKDSSRSAGRLYYNLSAILSGSGIIFSLSSLLNLIALLFDTEPYDFNMPREVSNIINVSVAGIAFNLVLIRVGQERSNPKNTYVSSLSEVLHSAPATTISLSQGASSTLADAG